MQSLQALDSQGNPLVKPPEWQHYYKEGSQFLDLAAAGLHNRQKFNGEALYNIIAMAIEKHFMALLLSKNSMPEGHTLKDLLAAAAHFITVDMELIKGLDFMDSLQEICSVDEFTIREPTQEELTRMVEIAWSVKKSVLQELPIDEEPLKKHSTSS